MRIPVYLTPSTRMPTPARAYRLLACPRPAPSPPVLRRDAALDRHALGLMSCWIVPPSETPRLRFWWVARGNARHLLRDAFDLDAGLTLPKRPSTASTKNSTVPGSCSRRTSSRTASSWRRFRRSSFRFHAGAIRRPSGAAPSSRAPRGGRRRCRLQQFGLLHVVDFPRLPRNKNCGPPPAPEQCSRTATLPRQGSRDAHALAAAAHQRLDHDGEADPRQTRASAPCPRHCPCQARRARSPRWPSSYAETLSEKESKFSTVGPTIRTRRRQTRVRRSDKNHSLVHGLDALALGDVHDGLGI